MDKFSKTDGIILAVNESYKNKLKLGRKQ